MEASDAGKWVAPIVEFNPFTSKENIYLPFPELLIYLLLQLRSKKLASNYREKADAKWPEEGMLRRVRTPTELSHDRLPNQMASSPLLQSTMVHDLGREEMLILENLEGILKMVAQSYGIEGATADTQLSLKQVDHLSYLFLVGLDDEGRFLPVSSVFEEWEEDREKKLPIGTIISTIKRLLKEQKDKAAKHQTFEVLRLEKKTMLRSGTAQSPLRGKDVRIVECLESYVYILNSTHRVSVIGCIDCTIFVGAAVSLSINACSRVKIIATAKNCRVTNCVDTTVYLCTNHKPQVIGDTRAVVFGPYNASYDQFERDAKVVGVDPTKNTWDDYYAPIGVSANSSAFAGSPNADQPSPTLPASVVTLLPPEKFFPFVVPIAKESEPTISSGVTPAPQAAPLPPKYAEIIERRKAEVEGLRKAVRTAQSKYTDDGKQEGSSGQDLQSVVQEYFRDWLITSGNLRQINDLVKLEEEFNKASGK
eukprot:CAMPEP_0184752118 /NCGR_PEP_ID=MMETSP0315-20130426/43410_1 /TAXON_ID=101924 /ORGANISM="Rhodosorus marinus, Strain UTEX LB 2760" /LENGTH=478 /DNA_ID=CAMNT_0027231435 /DNA_START=318 /DNA_END=1754 /DNA_ORIENTATION=+